MGGEEWERSSLFLAIFSPFKLCRPPRYLQAWGTCSILMKMVNWSSGYAFRRG
jgi:hypothetical protein